MRTQPRIGNVVRRVLAISASIGILFVIGCTKNSFTVGGTMSGLTGSGLVLQNNGGNNLKVSANGPFTFTTALASGATYSVTESSQPINPGQICGVTSGSGTVTDASIDSVAVTCFTTTSALIVTDAVNNRVLIYDAPFSTGQSANVVLGQANFTSTITANTAGTTASTTNFPAAIAMDSAGNLYVAEDGICRVTQFVPPFTNGMSASLVFGQPNLTTGICAASTSASGLGNGPTGGNLGDQVLGVIVDSSGDLWVADSGGNRVLEYKPPFGSGMAATLAIGQPDLISGRPNQGGAAPTAATLFDPANPIFDSSGNLWIADFGNSRVLEYSPPFATGMAASVVVGQADFNHGSPNQGGATGANTFDGTHGPTFDSSGNLWMADSGNFRVLEFQPPFTTNMNASLVLGQTDLMQSPFNKVTSPPTSATFFFPVQVSFDSNGRIFVSDKDFNRTLMFVPPFSNGMNASLVIGQPNFTSNQVLSPPTAASQGLPLGVITAPPF